MIYWDTSALIKKYFKEEGTNTVFLWLQKDSELLTCQLTYAEIHAAVARKVREKEISAKKAKTIVDSFENDWKALYVIKLSESVLWKVKNLVAKYPLRGADSVHLASALYAAEISKQKGLPFACSDIQLLKAAKSEKLIIKNPIA